MKVKLVAMATSARSTPRTLFGRAMWSGGELWLEMPVVIEQNYHAILNAAETRMRPLVAKGFTPLIDSLDQALASAGCAMKVNFYGKNTDNQSILGIAFSRFLEMKRLGQIIFPDENPTAFDVPQNIVNISTSIDGSARYEFDWPRVTAEHIYTLIMVYATTLPPHMHAGYMQAFRDSWPELEKESKGLLRRAVDKVKTVLTGEEPLPTSKGITKALDATLAPTTLFCSKSTPAAIDTLNRAVNLESQQVQAFTPSPLTGTRIDENTVIF